MDKPEFKGRWCERCGDRVFASNAAHCECGHVTVKDGKYTGGQVINWDGELDNQGWNPNMKVCEGYTLMLKPCKVITWNEGKMCNLPHAKEVPAVIESHDPT